MLDDETEREEIDLLIRGLAARKRVPPALRPEPSQPPAPPAPPLPPLPPSVRPVARSENLSHPGSRWSDVRLSMPSKPAPTPWNIGAYASAISFPHLPDFSRLFRLPGRVTVVRMWVGLGAAHAAAMTFWPYPKTYLWGLVMYLLSLGLSVATGAWGARLSWEERLGAAHTVALCTVLWAVLLAGAEMIPLL